MSSFCQWEDVPRSDLSDNEVQKWNYIPTPWKSQQLLKGKERSQFNCQEEHHQGTAILLSVKCQYRCNNDGTQ